MASHPVTKLTAEEYLAIDRAAEYKSEFFDGEIVAMSGGSLRHSRLQVNLAASMHNALRGSSCQAFSADLRVRVAPRIYTYPDLTIVCGEPKLADDRQDILLNPTIIFEVLSPSTERYDRGIKAEYYRGIESLRDYIVVAQDRIHVEQYTRADDHLWTLRDHDALASTLRIDSIGTSIPLAAIYERIEFPAE